MVCILLIVVILAWLNYVQREVKNRVVDFIF